MSSSGSPTSPGLTPADLFLRDYVKVSWTCVNERVCKDNYLAKDCPSVRSFQTLCGHLFHRECITAHLKHNDYCPECWKQLFEHDAEMNHASNVPPATKKLQDENYEKSLIPMFDKIADPSDPRVEECDDHMKHTDEEIKVFVKEWQDDMLVKEEQQKFNKEHFNAFNGSGPKNAAAQAKFLEQYQEKMRLQEIEDKEKLAASASKDVCDEDVEVKNAGDKNAEATDSGDRDAGDKDASDKDKIVGVEAAGPAVIDVEALIKAKNMDFVAQFQEKLRLQEAAERRVHEEAEAHISKYNGSKDTNNTAAKALPQNRKVVDESATTRSPLDRTVDADTSVDMVKHLEAQVRAQEDELKVTKQQLVAAIQEQREAHKRLLGEM